MFRASSLNSFFGGEACSFSILNDKGWEVGGHSDCHRVMSQEWRLVMRTMHQFTITSGHQAEVRAWTWATWSKYCVSMNNFKMFWALRLTSKSTSTCLDHDPDLTRSWAWQLRSLHSFQLVCWTGVCFSNKTSGRTARLSFLVQCLTSLETDSHTLQTPKMLVTQYTWRLADWVFYCVSPCIVSICPILWLTLWN